jgi:hypothetical protein
MRLDGSTIIHLKVRECNSGRLHKGNQLKASQIKRAQEFGEDSGYRYSPDKSLQQLKISRMLREDRLVKL